MTFRFAGRAVVLPSPSGGGGDSWRGLSASRAPLREPAAFEKHATDQ
jgi:hypothetical protein